MARVACAERQRRTLPCLIALFTLLGGPFSALGRLELVVGLLCSQGTFPRGTFIELF